MDRVEIIKAIVDADKRAREFPTNAKTELDSLGDALREERIKVRDEYFARAEKRIEAVRAAENDYADEQIRALDARLVLDIQASKDAAERHFEQWTDELFRAIIAAPLGE